MVTKQLPELPTLLIHSLRLEKQSKCWRQSPILLIKNKRGLKSKYSVDFYVASFLISFSVGWHGSTFIAWKYVLIFSEFFKEYVFFLISRLYPKKLLSSVVWIYFWILSHWKETVNSLHAPFYMFIYLSVGIGRIEHVALTSFSCILAYWISVCF